MADSGKRKSAHDVGGAALRKKKKGNNGRWTVPKSDASGRPKGNTIEPGDMGIWLTCPLHMKGKAAREMETLFDEYAEKMYGIKTEEAADGESDEGADIESAIQKEVGTLKDKNKGSSNLDRVFTEVRINQECLLFMRCKSPIEPVEFSQRICQDAATVGHGAVRSRYLNRLTPVSVIVKATESAIEEGARKLFASHFKLRPTEANAGTNPDVAGPELSSDTQESSADERSEPAKYAIRPSIRNHSTLKRDDVIKNVANLIHPGHKVNLGAPEKVILVDIYQTICGLSVVPGDYETLKRYNLTELYKRADSGSQSKNEISQKDPVEEHVATHENKSEA